MLGRALVVCPVDASNPMGRATVLALSLARVLGGRIICSAFRADARRPYLSVSASGPTIRPATGVASSSGG